MIEIEYNITNQMLIFTIRKQKPISINSNFCVNAFLDHVTSLSGHEGSGRVIEKTPKIKVYQFTFFNIIPSVSKVLLFKINFETVYRYGTIITQMHLNNFIMNAHGYRGNISFDCIQVERFSVLFTYSDELNTLDPDLETSRVVHEIDTPFSYIHELVTMTGDNPLHGLNLRWSYRPIDPPIDSPIDSPQEIDQANLSIDHTSITYAQLADAYGEGNIHINNIVTTFLFDSITLSQQLTSFAFECLLISFTTLSNICKEALSFNFRRLLMKYINTTNNIV
jgi:hypothetical protein